jgi:hypothetical protein
MAGYLDQYGAGEDQRNTVIFRTIAILVIAAILISLGWYLFKNHHQESVVKRFLNDVRHGDFQAAYHDWGCGEGHACAGYSFDKFMSDWGPGKNAPSASVLHLADSESCNNGVLLTVNVNPSRQEALWVDKTDDAISFAPYPVCPHKSAFSIMIHRTVGKLRKPLLQ